MNDNITPIDTSIKNLLNDVIQNEDEHANKSRIDIGLVDKIKILAKTDKAIDILRIRIPEWGNACVSAYVNKMYENKIPEMYQDEINNALKHIDILFNILILEGYKRGMNDYINKFQGEITSIALDNLVRDYATGFDAKMYISEKLNELWEKYEQSKSNT